MGPKIDLKLHHSGKTLCQVGIMRKKIVNQLKREGIIISESPVSKLKNFVGKRNQARNLGTPQRPNASPQKVRKPTPFQQMDAGAKNERTPPQNHLEMKCKISGHTLERIIQ